MWLGAYKYAFEILRRRRTATWSRPEVIVTVDSGVVWRFLGPAVRARCALRAAAAHAEQTLIYGGLALLVFLQPALTMTLAMTGSLTSALSPRDCVLDRRPHRLAVRRGRRLARSSSS
jgi:hypothetical protein